MSNTLDYTAYDFDDLVTQLQNRVKEVPTWKDTYLSGTGAMLIDLLAYVQNMDLYYIERRAEESYLDTAKNRSSVINLVRLLNYSRKLDVSSTGELTFTLVAPHSYDVMIPRYTQCSTSAGLVYSTTEDVKILAGDTTATSAAIQGKIVQIEVAADGSQSYAYNINDTQVENTNTLVYVDGTQWTEVSSFLLSTATSKEYKLRYELDDTVSVLFGDGVKGAIPTAGDTILIQYVKSDGLSGNAYSSPSITTIDSKVYDSEATLVTDLSVTNAAAFIGGEDIETTDEIRYNAPRVFATGDRAVTKDDYIAILEDYSGVASANAWGEAEETSPDPSVNNVARLCMLLQDWVDPDTDFQTALTAYLYTKAQITVKYEYKTAIQLYIVPRIILVVEKGYSLTEVEDNVTTALENDFELGTTAEIGESRRFTEVVTTISAVAGVVYHQTVLDVRKLMTYGYTSLYDYGSTLEASPILKESVRVYHGSTQIAVDNGAGGWTSTGGAYTVTGNISYTTGVTNMDIAPAPTLPIAVLYNQSGSDDIVVTKRQICRLSSVTYTSVTYNL